MKTKLNILILGSGMFVTGRGTDNFGTILPSIFEASNNLTIDNIIICSTAIKSSKLAKDKVDAISKIYKKRLNIQYFPNINNKKYDLNKLINDYEINCSIISLPDHLHCKFALKIMKKNVHCLVVKPMTTSKENAIKMIKLSKKNNLLGMVEFHKRYDEANLVIKDRIRNNEIGNLQYAIIEYSQRKTIPIKSFKTWVNKTNIFQYLAVHYVDLIFYLTNFKPLIVHTFYQNDFLKKQGVNNYDSIQVIVEWKRNDNKKFVSIHTSNWIDSEKSSAMSDQIIKIVGEKGKIISDQKNRGLQIVTDQKGINDLNPYFTTSLSVKNNLTNQSFGYGIKSVFNFLKLCEYFISNKKINVEKYIKDKKNIPSFFESYVSTAVIEAVNKSLKKGKSIKINL